tara:strand:- start:221 stop:592 length:372 start_codon:yes stop_codon:yes gene_type:complete
LASRKRKRQRIQQEKTRIKQEEQMKYVKEIVHHLKDHPIMILQNIAKGWHVPVPAQWYDIKKYKLEIPFDDKPPIQPGTKVWKMVLNEMLRQENAEEKKSIPILYLGRRTYIKCSEYEIGGKL